MEELVKFQNWINDNCYYNGGNLQVYNSFRRDVAKYYTEVTKVEKRLSFNTLKESILRSKAKSEYKQASIVILRKIFEDY